MKGFVFRRTIVSLLFVGMVMLAGWGMASGSTVRATVSNSKMFISADNTFFLYAKGGEKINASFVRSDQIEPSDIPPVDVTVSLEGPGMDRRDCLLPKTIQSGKGCGFSDVVAPQTGVYRISFKLPDTARVYSQVTPTLRWGANMFAWDISVGDDSGKKSGRLWSELYAVRQPYPAEYMTDLVYYYVSESGYLYKATYKGYNGQISTLSADAFGIRTGKTCQSAYQSIEVSSTTMSPSFGTCGASYKLFFEPPSGELPASAKQWDDKTAWVNPAVIRPEVSDLEFISDKSGDVQSGKIRLKLRNFVGQYVVKIDTDNDGRFDESQDVKFTRTIKKLADSSQEIEFNGINREGQQVSPSQPIGIKVQIEKTAEIHLVNADVEGRAGGLELMRLNGDNAPTTRMCWDDTGLTTLATNLMTKLVDGRSCPDSRGGVHGWNYETGSWGDMRYIEDWAYASAKVDGETQIVYPREDGPVIAKIGGVKVQTVVVSVGAGILLLVIAGFVVTIIVRRRRHARMLREAIEQHKPTDYPGPGDPRPPLQ